MRGYAIVEGKGELDAVENLLARLWGDLGHQRFAWTAIRGKNLLQQKGVQTYAEVARRRSDCAVLILLRDADDDCPRTTGPQTASWLRSLGLPFPTAVTLFRREYETMFLPCLPVMADRTLVAKSGVELPGVRAGAQFRGNYEGPRDVKKVIGSYFPSDRPYKPTVHQLPLTRMMDFGMLRASGLPSFGTLERSLNFLAGNLGRRGAVYPP